MFTVRPYNPPLGNEKSKKKKNISKHYKISLTYRLPSYSAVWGGTGLVTMLPLLVAAQQLLKNKWARRGNTEQFMSGLVQMKERLHPHGIDL